MPLSVTDVRGGAEHQISEAAKALGRAPQRRAVFLEMHRGKKRIKTASEIAESIDLPRKRVLEEAVKLAHKQIITQTVRDGEIAYERDNFYYVHQSEILRRADGRRPQIPLSRSTSESGERGTRASRKPRPVRRRSVQRRYDVFLSHASEDKKAIARPLHEALVKANVSVWFDEATLTLGDSLRRKIDEGLSRCKFGVVILSPSFFAKDWPQRELDGLVARENASGQKAIIPIWHKLTKVQVANQSPMLADRLAGKSTDGTRKLVVKIKEVLASAKR